MGLTQFSMSGFNWIESEVGTNQLSRSGHDFTQTRA